MKKITLFFCFLFALILLFAQDKQANFSRVKIYASTQEHFNALLLKGVCLENLDIKNGVHIIGEFSVLELQKIQETEIPYEILIANMSEYYVKQNEGYSIAQLNDEMKRNPKTYNGNKTPAHFHLGSMGGFFTLAEIMTELDEMRAAFPNLISVKTPFSLQTVEGRNIYWVRISNNPDMEQEKPRVLYTALTHAREPASMHQMIYQMWELLENYGVDPEITYCLDNLELYFVPCVCPDGYEYNRQTNPYGGGMWRKNRKGGYGIDLNRNWGYKWGYDNYGSSPNQWDETYRGSAPFSEVETQVLKNFCENTEILLCLNNHTFSNLLVLPYGYVNAVPPEYPIFRTYAEKLTTENRYSYGNCYQVLNYFSNGSSEDWFCGERETKNLIISYCPEAGDPYDGFWPPASQIEEICAGHVLMNKYMMRFALPYAEIEDKTEFAFQSLENTFKFELISLGLTPNVDFEVSIEPVSINIHSTQTTPLYFQNLYTLDKKQGEFTIFLKPTISSDEKIVFDICVNNGTFTHKYRFTKLFGSIEKIFEDNCETMNNWTSTDGLGKWGITTVKYNSPTHSIADSPYGNYESGENSTIYSKNFYDLIGAIAVFAEFEAQWDIEANYDYVQFLVSANNGPWEPQQGKYTKPGSAYQGYETVYDGIQMDWVHEIIDLSKYIGKKIKVGFKLVSDWWTERDGFYFDDFVLSVVKPIEIPPLPPILNLPDTISFLDIEQDCVFKIFDYVITQNFDDLTVQWKGNEYFIITFNEETKEIHISVGVPDKSWTGCETVTFTVGNEVGESSQNMVIQCVKTDAVQTFDTKSFNVYFDSKSQKLIITNVEINTSFFLYNIEGKLLDSFYLDNKNHVVDVSKLRPGVYFLKTNFGEVQKVIIY